MSRTESMVAFVATAVVLVAFFLLGGWLHHQWLPTIPPAVIGMVLLFVGLLLLGRVPRWFELSIQKMLRHFTLFLLPPSVGVIAIWPEIAARAGSVVATLVVSTLVTLFFVVVVYYRLSRSSSHE